MPWSARRIVDKAIKPFGYQLSRLESSKSWDRQFRRWIADAKSAGRDPNDIGDEQWEKDDVEGDRLYYSLKKHYLPYIDKSSVVLELGPGSGRLSRHIITKCEKIIFIDYSRFVIDYMMRYMKDKGQFEGVRNRRATNTIC